MIGFRILAFFLALICLAAAGLMTFHECPRAAAASEFFIRHFVPDSGVRTFIKSAAPADIRIKSLIKYGLSGLAVGVLGLGLLFFCAMANPIRMRPFIAVVMIVSALGMVAAVAQGLRLGVFKSWWIGDVSGGLILLILLAALFPVKKPAAASSFGESGELPE